MQMSTLHCQKYSSPGENWLRRCNQAEMCASTLVCMLTVNAQPQGNSMQAAHQPCQGSCKLSSVPMAAC